MKQSGRSPVWSVALVTHVNKDRIVVIGTSNGVLVLADAFVQASTCLANVLEGASSTRDRVSAHLTLVGRGSVYQAPT